MVFCFKCGTSLLEDAKFCMKCGTPVPVEGPAEPSPAASPDPLEAQPVSAPHGEGEGAPSEAVSNDYEDEDDGAEIDPFADDAPPTGDNPFGPNAAASGPATPSTPASAPASSPVREPAWTPDPKIRDRLVEFYMAHNPAKLSSPNFDIDQTLYHYRGREELLFEVRAYVHVAIAFSFISLLHCYCFCFPLSLLYCICLPFPIFILPPPCLLFVYT